MPTLYPKEVSVNEANLARLIKTYTQAQESILNELATATDWGVANRKQLLAQIDSVLEDLNKQTQEWLEKEIPKQYTAGANDAVMQLNNVGADVAVQTGFNRIHKDAIIGLVDETAAAFAQGLTGVSRSGQVLLGKLTREALTQKLAQGIIGGQALKEVRREIKGVLMEQGVGALVDKGGHTWTLDRYADMLFRTKQVEARNRGIANRLVENGYDLVQVSSHGTDHAECAIWEGKILSASGATRGYPTVMEATAAGLFHPNCKHAINVLVPKLARLTHAYDPDMKTAVIYEPKLPKKTKPLKKEPVKTINVAGRWDFEVTPAEAKFIEDRNISIKTNTKIKAVARYVQDSTFGPSGLEFNPNNMNANLEVNKRVFYHELGHALDWRSKYITNEKGIDIYQRRTREQSVYMAVRKSKMEIILKRAEDEYLFANYPGITPDQKKELLTTGSTKASLPSGTGTVPIKLQRKYLNYLKSDVELFAEGYARYRIDPIGFEKIAPELVKIYKGLL